MGKPESKDLATRERVFEAAQSAFHEHGFDGARMQDIAGRAGLNHSTLHYYFRDKGTLFDAVFRRAALQFLPPLIAVLRSDRLLLPKLDAFVELYITSIATHPHMPGFLLLELRRNPDALRSIVGEMGGGVLEHVRGDIEAAVARAESRPITAEDLMANVMGLCIMPFLARPLLQTLLAVDDPGYEVFLSGRIESTKTFIRQALSI